MCQVKKSIFQIFRMAALRFISLLCMAGSALAVCTNPKVRSRYFLKESFHLSSQVTASSYTPSDSQVWCLELWFPGSWLSLIRSSLPFLSSQSSSLLVMAERWEVLNCRWKINRACSCQENWPNVTIILPSKTDACPLRWHRWSVDASDQEFWGWEVPGEWSYHGLGNKIISLSLNYIDGNWNQGFLDPRGEESNNWWQECCLVRHWGLHCFEKEQSFRPGGTMMAYQTSPCLLPGLHCVSPGDHRDPLPWQLLWTLAQLWAPRCSPCSCGFLPGFLFKVCAKRAFSHNG